MGGEHGPTSIDMVMWVILVSKMGLLRPKNGHFEETFLLITVTWLGPTPMIPMLVFAHVIKLNKLLGTIRLETSAV